MAEAAGFLIFFLTCFNKKNRVKFKCVKISEKVHNRWKVKSLAKISICVGSACHLRGAHGVLDAFIALIAKYNVGSEVDMAGNFCHGRCTEGVVIKIDDEIITNVSKDKVYDIFIEKVLKGNRP
ncbi:MAG: (2Fe-2S) ferredoxin domain-containing protein [Negativicutes bacterium]